MQLNLRIYHFPKYKAHIGLTSALEPQQVKGHAAGPRCV